jgi:N-acetylglucosamine-6-sulfatase
MNNLFPISSTRTLLGYPLTQVTARLDAVLMVLKSCKGQQCRMPWTILHPDGEVHNLRDALNPQYDSFYATQAKVSFSSCELGYILAAEGPQEVREYDAMKYHLGD